jgi:rhodanese-related sulfurtransferase
MAKTIKDMMAHARDGLVELTPEQARARLDAGDAVFIDVRDGLEVQKSGKVPGAIHASRGLLEFALDPAGPMHDPRISSGKTLIFYCASGGRSALASRTARDMGYGDVCHIGGGFGAWVGDGGPTEG